MPYYVYILASKRNGSLYIGSTSDLVKRIWEHKEKLRQGFTQRYGIDKLVYFEKFQELALMGQRERRLKEWRRTWKIRLIEENNPNWDDLYEVIAK
jgi:putative endonuclease